MKYITTIDTRAFNIEIFDENRLSVDGVMYEVDFQSVSGQPVYSLLVDGRSFEAYVSPNDGEWQVLLHGNLYNVLVEDEREKRLRAASQTSASKGGTYNLKSPMPGLVVAVAVEDGQEVQAGEVLIILESMKMQNELRAPYEGVITRIRVKAGDSVDQNQVLLVVE